jgi:putative ABC transport system ATP-binding protein
MQKVIEIKEIKKTYQVGDQLVHALAGVNLEIVRNEYVAIMGPSVRANHADEYYWLS